MPLMTSPLNGGVDRGNFSALYKSSLMKNAPNVTPREKEVLLLIAHEYSTKEIAEKLYISYETANTHRKNLLKKMDVKNTAGLVRAGFQSGLLRIAVILLCNMSLPI